MGDSALNIFQFVPKQAVSEDRELQTGPVPDLFSTICRFMYRVEHIDSTENSAREGILHALNLMEIAQIFFVTY